MVLPAINKGRAGVVDKQNGKGSIFVSGLLFGILATSAYMQGCVVWRIDDTLSVATFPAVTECARKPDLPGWHSINVFFGNRSTLVADSQNRKWFSQVRQDELIVDLVGTKGYFIDLAANDATDLSNTFALEQLGWDGLCVEPNPGYWYGLSHRKCQVFGAMVGGVSVQEVDVKLVGVIGGMVGLIEKTPGLVPEQFDGVPTVKRYTTPLKDVFKMAKVPAAIDYLSLDVEGAEYLVMKDFPFNQYQFKLLTVERPVKELMDLLEHNNYIFLKQLSNWGETLWAHASTGLTPDDPRLKKAEEFPDVYLWSWLK